LFSVEHFLRGFLGLAGRHDRSIIMWRIRRLAIVPVLALLIAAMAAISMPLANAGASPDPGWSVCAPDHNGQLRYAECLARRPRHHQPPVLAGIEAAALRYTAGGPPAPVTASLTVSSPASGTLTGATVSVGSGFTAGQDSLGFTGRSGIKGSFKASSGVLTLTGPATVAAYQAALRSVTYRDTDAAAPYGTRSISFQVSDGEPDHALSNSVSRTVQVVAKPPVAAGDTATTGKNTPVTVNVLANDTDAAGLPLTIASVGTSGTKGTVAVNPSQTTVTYNPNGQFAGLAAGQTATDKFTYKATDGRQTSSSATVTVTITGSGGASQPPSVTSHSYNAVGNTPLGVGTTPAAPAATVSGTVLSGDSDPDPTATLSVTATTAPAHGTVTVNPNGTFTYLPDPGYTGADTFKCTIAGSNAPTVTATETVTVNVGTVVWYVNNNLTAAGNGEAASPFNMLAAADTAAGPDSIIFLYQGKTDYTGGVTMRAGEDLWGQPHGLTADGYSLVPAGGSTPVITNTSSDGGGDGIDLAEGADVEGVNVTGPTRNGIGASNVNNATVGATTAVVVSGAGGYGISVNDGDGNLNFGTTSVFGAAVGVGGRSGGTVTFGGPITGAEVSLTGNDGATIAFTGKLTLTGFQAGGTEPPAEGGTVTATGTGSTINGQLAVQDATIGAAGLTFQSISSDAANEAYGIDLWNTGTSGGLTVTGTGTPGSGGTISAPASASDPGPGIELTLTYEPSFTDMVIEDDAGAIDGLGVDGLTLADSTTGALNFGPTPPNSGLTGTASITNSTITGAGITDGNGTLNLTATGNTFSEAHAGLELSVSAGATTCAVITGNSGAGRIYLDNGSTIELPGYTGGPDDTGAVASYLEGRNSVPATAMVYGSGGGFTGGSDC
jgi:large repetitive protein